MVGGLSERARELLDRVRTVPMAGLAGLIVAWMLLREWFWPLYLPIVHALWS